MVAIKDIGWGSYGGYEGPRYIGSKKYFLPQNPTFDQKAMLVVSSSEGNAGSVNMYDRAIISVGFIQWIELGQYSVSNMIGQIAEDCGIDLVLQKLGPALMMSKATFKKTPSGLWRFHIPHPTTGDEVAVTSEALSRWLFARGSGKLGTWTETNKLWAKMWASNIADLFETDAAVESQVNWTIPQLRKNFVWKNGQAIVFEPGSSYEGYAGALKALLVAYGVNRPADAEKVITRAAARSKYPKWSMQWCLDMMHDLALTSGNKLWPGRYNYKRPALEMAFGINLPKNNVELAQRLWDKIPVEILPPPSPPPLPPPVENEKPSNVVEFPTVEDTFVRPEPPAPPPSASVWQTFWNVASAIAGKIKFK